MMKTARESHVMHARQDERNSPAAQTDTTPSGATVSARTMNPMRMLRLAQVIEKTELRKTTIYKLQKQGRFPKAVSLTDHSVRWVESEIEDWLTARAATRKSAGIK
jgi:prophage regulatory protein